MVLIPSYNSLLLSAAQLEQQLRGQTQLLT